MKAMKIDLTPGAEKFIRQLIAFDGGPDYGLRLLVSPGGCSGLSAEFSVEAAPREGEVVYAHKELKLFLPVQSRLLLDGVTVDFVETPTSSGFVFHAPKAKGCACASESAMQFSKTEPA
jgi:iron-sulfur cluster assembly accessory protein